MKALRFHDRRDIRLEDIPIPEPGPGQVRMKVTDAGLSQTQIGEFMEGPFIITQDTHPMTGFSGPIIPCQEYGGVVDKVGQHVDPALVGTQAAALPLISCGACRNCQVGRNNVCATLAYRGVLGADGGFCDYSIVDADQLFPVTDPVLLNFVEPLLIGVHSSKRIQHLDWENALVIGAGAVGCALAAVWQDCIGADVTVFDLLPNRLARAQAMGLTTTSDEPEPAGYDIVVDAAGKEVVHDRDALVEAIDYCRPGGTVVSLGTYFSTLSFAPAGLTIPERSIISSFAYDDTDVDDLSNWIGKLTCDFSQLTTEVSLDRLIEDGYYQAEVDKDAFTRIVTRGDA